MFLTGISDEAGLPLEVQIRAHRELGWNRLEVRGVEVPGFSAGNLHDIEDAAFDLFEHALKEAGMEVFCFASMVANGKSKMHEPFERTLEQVHRALPRMKRLGTRVVRIMSFGICWDSADQQPQERFRRLRILVEQFQDAGVKPLHENCGNYGGLGWRYTEELLSEVPGMGLIFDTGNPVFSDDRTKPEPWPKQSSWEFYQHVRGRIDHVHIKDGVWDPATRATRFCFPGEGDGDVVRIVGDLMESGYNGGLSIEPHMETQGEGYATYLAYGRKLQSVVDRERVREKD